MIEKRGRSWMRRRSEPVEPAHPLDTLVAALTHARPVLDEATRARVGALVAAATQRWAVGSAVATGAADAEAVEIDEPPARRRWLGWVVGALAVIAAIGLASIVLWGD